MIWTDFVKSIYAGIAIGIGTVVYMLNPGILGAVLFTIGLFIVVNNRFNLFTGKVGYETKWKNWSKYIYMILGNLLGIVCFVSLIYFTGAVKIPVLSATAVKIISTRLSTSYMGILMGSIGCGMLMSHAVDRPNRSQDDFKNPLSYLPMFYCVPVFIICGFPHCIADIAYHLVYGLSVGFQKTQFFIWFWSIIGNFIGCQIMGQLKNKG
jgi:formate/nitrite transporter FocA (FNT family)